MNMLARIMCREILPQTRVDSIAEIPLYVASVLVLAFGYRKLASLGLDEKELFFGILLVLTLSVLLVVAGQLVKLTYLVKHAKKD